MALGWWSCTVISCSSALTAVLLFCNVTHASKPTRSQSTSNCPFASGLLQRRAGRSSSFHASIVPVSPARSGMHRSGSQAAWPCDSSSSRVALVASHCENLVQTVLAGSQVTSGTYAGIYLRPSNTPGYAYAAIHQWHGSYTITTITVPVKQVSKSLK